MERVELLAPVGSYDSFISAINNGADAIYLAGEHFGAREKATFSNEQIKEMISYAHINEVKVHVVINTLIYDDEVEKVMEFVDFLYINDVDALIVQDLGMINLIHKTYPDLPIHASTQLNTLTLKQASVLKSLGVTRVILAREASLNLVKEIKSLGLEVEVFAHGALCVSYSGQCLFSSFTMKKSGNRGECLQLCRLPYKLEKNGHIVKTNGDYLLSCKDLNTLDNLDKLIESGVTSLKIEGRVKSANYVGKVVSVYRKYIDEYYLNKTISVTSNDQEEVAKVFNRGFTKGYIFNEKNEDIVNCYRPNNMGVIIGKVVEVNNNKVKIKLSDSLHQGDGIRIVSDNKDEGMFVNMLYLKGLLVKEGHKGNVISINVKGKILNGSEVYKTSDYLLNEAINKANLMNKKFPISILVKAYKNQKLVMEASDNLNHLVRVESDYVIDIANNNPTSKERIKQQVSKLNESYYYLDNFKFEGDEMIIIPISIINKLRNELVNELNRTRSKINNRNGKQEVYFKDIKIEKDDFSYVYKVSNLDQLKVVKEYASSEDIYFKSDDNIYPYPRISNGLIKVNNKQILINELSDLDSDKIVIANAYLNTTNIYALYTLYSLGVKRVTLSLELGFERIKNMIERYKDVFNEIPNVEVIVYGKIDLMVTKHCLINKATSCLNKNNCNDDYALIDRKGYRLKLVKDGLCNIRILNPKKLHLIDYLDKLKLIGVSKLRLEFNDESSEEVKKVIEGYKNNYLELSGVSNGYFSEEERQ